MTTKANRAWRLIRRPDGLLSTQDIALVSEQVAELKDGEVLIRHLFLSLDPECRLYLREEETLVPPVELGQVLLGIGIGVIDDSRNREFRPGEVIRGFLGWQEYTVTKGDGLERLPRDRSLPLAAYIAVLGHVGLTAYYGLLEAGAPRNGDTLVVSTGAVGSLAGQIGKIKGCRVIGIAGNMEMYRWAKEELGFDAVIDGRDESILEALRSACPDGIDIYFDTLGGRVLDAALQLINHRARIVLGGMISQYSSGWSDASQGVPHLINVQFARARIQGISWLDYQDRKSEATRLLTQWVGEGKLKYRIQMVRGLENAPLAFNKNFNGSSSGKLICMVSDPSRSVPQKDLSCSV